MEELRRGRRGRSGQVALLGHADGQTATGGIARDAAAVDPATDDEDVERITHP
jgi:hypothetical protein